MKKNDLLFKIMMFLLLVSFSLLLSGAQSNPGVPEEVQVARQVAVDTAKSISHGSNQQKWREFALQEPLLLISICATAE